LGELSEGLGKTIRLVANQVAGEIHTSPTEEQNLQVEDKVPSAKRLAYFIRLAGETALKKFKLEVQN